MIRRLGDPADFPGALRCEHSDIPSHLTLAASRAQRHAARRAPPRRWWPRRRRGTMTGLARTRAAEVGAFYRRHHATLARAVARRARASQAAIEEACQTAWTQLLGRADVTLDAHGLNWLVTVTTHEAWRLASIASEVPAGQLMGASDPHGDARLEPLALDGDPLAAAIAHDHYYERLADLAHVNARELRPLLLQAAGYSYQEIMAMTGASYTAVNRRLKARPAQLRALARERASTEGGEARAREP